MQGGRLWPGTIFGLRAERHSRKDHQTLADPAFDNPAGTRNRQRYLYIG